MEIFEKLYYTPIEDSLNFPLKKISSKILLG